MKRLQQHTLRLCLGLGLAASARADVVSDWNVIALQAIAASQPPPGGRYFSIPRPFTWQCTMQLQRLTASSGRILRRYRALRAPR